jgi:hypothetical protein
VAEERKAGARRRKTFFTDSSHENLKDYMGIKEGTKKK